MNLGLEEIRTGMNGFSEMKKRGVKEGAIPYE